MMNVVPTKLQRQGDDALVIEWSDGQQRSYLVRELRDACPCATCRETHGPAAKPAQILPILSLEETRPVRVLGMKPVGNYAYSIQFSDGHDTGIYSFELLRELGTAST